MQTRHIAEYTESIKLNDWLDYRVVEKSKCAMSSIIEAIAYGLRISASADVDNIELQTNFAICAIFPPVS